MLPVLGAVLVGLVITQVAFVVTTVYLHRSLSHRALRLSAPATAVFRVLTWMLTGIRPRQWVAVHRKHHAYTDTERDPHSPLVLGTAKVLLANAALYRRAARDPATARYARDLPPDRWDRVLFDHALLGLGLGLGLLVLLLGWQLALIAAAVHTVTYLLGGGAINAVGHRFGRRPFDNRATNNQWLAWLVAGEGLHNNHHAAATASKLSMARGQVDPGWWCIRMLVATGQATLRARGGAPVSALASTAAPPASTAARRASTAAVASTAAPLASTGGFIGPAPRPGGHAPSSAPGPVSLTDC